MTDHDFMQLALLEAEKAAKLGEIPIGAVVVRDGNVIASAHNQKETSKDPTDHAEILAIKQAALTLGAWRLEDCKLFVTLEPCLMCSGAILQSRITEVIFATRDPKGGAVISCCESFNTPNINHRPKWQEGVMQVEASLLLKNFFKELRSNK
jgi:tRNA(adenine34) deaminase